MDVIFGKKDAPDEVGRDLTQTRQVDAGTPPPPPTTATRVLDMIYGQKETPEEIDPDSVADRTRDDQP